MVRGNLVSSLSMMNGRRKLFQMPMNCSMKTVTSPGTIIGMAIERKMRNSLAPSIRAASMVSSGTEDCA